MRCQLFLHVLGKIILARSCKYKASNKINSLSMPQVTSNHMGLAEADTKPLHKNLFRVQISLIKAKFSLRFLFATA